jgi:CheY-like chemotaxis protein
MGRVLIIDDDGDSLEALSTYLRKARHSVRCAANGRQAVESVMADAPDAILLDVRMPDMDGIEVLKVLRSYARWAVIPVAIFTAYPEDPRLWHVSEYGVTRVFAKAKSNLDHVLEWVNEQAGRASPPPEMEPPGTQAGA